MLGHVIIIDRVGRGERRIGEAQPVALEVRISVAPIGVGRLRRLDQMFGVCVQINDAQLPQTRFAFVQHPVVGKGFDGINFNCWPVRNPFLPVSLAGRSDRRGHHPEIFGLPVRGDQDIAAVMLHAVFQLVFAWVDDRRRRGWLFSRNKPDLFGHRAVEVKQQIALILGLGNLQPVGVIRLMHDEGILAGVIAQLMPEDFIGAPGRILFVIEEGAVIRRPLDTVEGVGNRIGQGFTGC